MLALLTLALVSCTHTGAANNRRSARTTTGGGQSSQDAHARAPAQIAAARPIAMTRTPSALLEFCRRSPLLHPICPSRIPAWGSASPGVNAEGYSCIDRKGRQPIGGPALARLFASRRCVDATWSFEDGKFSPLLTPRHQVAAWDGSGWFAPASVAMDAPPWHVHVQIEAKVGSLPAAGGPPLNTQGAHDVTDALLNPKRIHPVSFGWVRWYGRAGELVLAPANVSGGAWAGHLIFYYTSRRVGYAITLHAWASKERFTGRGVNRVVKFEAGPALPHVIASLKRIVGSGLRR